MRTETNNGGAARKNGLSAAKQAFSLFSLLVVSLTIGYFLYSGGQTSEKPNDDKIYSNPGTEERQGVDKNSNAGIKITKAKLQFESVGNTDRIRVIIPENRDDGSRVAYKYEWFKNGEPYGSNEDNVTGFKKDDRIAVKITPFDGEKNGQAVLLALTISRVSPQIVENKTVDFDGKTVSYQVKAVDPDGGTLSYSLIKAPEDMTIDSATGMINWPVKTRGYGKHSINVMIKSSSGAEVVYPFSIDTAKLGD